MLDTCICIKVDIVGTGNCCGTGTLKNIMVLQLAHDNGSTCTHVHTAFVHSCYYHTWFKIPPNFWTYVASQSSRTVTNIIGMVPVPYDVYSKHILTVPFLSSAPYVGTYLPVQLALIPPHLSYTNIFLQHTLIFSTVPGTVIFVKLRTKTKFRYW